MYTLFLLLSIFLLGLYFYAKNCGNGDLIEGFTNSKSQRRDIENKYNFINLDEYLVFLFVNDEMQIIQ